MQVRIQTPHWLKRKVIYFGKEMENFFPSDALGDRDTMPPALEPRRAQPVIFDYGVVQSECDLAVKRNKQGTVAQMRPRDTSPIGEFFKRNSAAVGDQVTVTKVSPRKFEIRLVKTDGSTL